MFRQEYPLFRCDTVRRRWKQGVGLVSEDRKTEGLALNLSIADNLTLSRLDGLGPPGLVLPARQNTAGRRWIERLGIKCRGPRQSVGALSGGNQQKLVVGRALAQAPRLVLAYQPTRGIDIGAAALVRSRLIEARNAGVAILLVSFELDEIFALADVVLVLFRGAFVGRFERAELDRGGARERIGASMIGAHLTDPARP